MGGCSYPSWAGNQMSEQGLGRGALRSPGHHRGEGTPLGSGKVDRARFPNQNARVAQKIKMRSTFPYSPLPKAANKQTSLVAQTVKNISAVQESWVWSLGREVPLEKGMATHSSILAWESPWTEEPVGLQSVGSQRVGHDWRTNTFPVESPALNSKPCESTYICLGATRHLINFEEPEFWIMFFIHCQNFRASEEMMGKLTQEPDSKTRKSKEKT